MYTSSAPDAVILFYKATFELIMQLWEKNIIRVGVGVLVSRDGNFLIGKRWNAHGSGDWCPPGGHVEFGESFEETARREVMEETGLEIKNVRFGGVTNDVFEKEGLHYVTVWMLSDWAGGRERITEPHKLTELRWQNFDNLPQPLFGPLKRLLDSQFIESIRQELAASS